MKERVIFRIEKDKYREADNILAIFPDITANPGRYACIPFFFKNDKPVFEPFCEADINYLLNCKIIHKNNPMAKRALSAIESYLGENYRIMERIV